MHSTAPLPTTQLGRWKLLATRLKFCARRELSRSSRRSRLCMLGGFLPRAFVTVFAALIIGAAPNPLAAAADNVNAWDNFSDTWVATDALGRNVVTSPEALPPRADRTVAMFYFLWHGAHVHGGPYDISRILQQDPDAMSKHDSPLWGPLHVPHHWGQSIFGYYRIRDDGVLRKHAQMLSDAGVDAVIFDVSNQVTYRDDYLALLRVWSELRAAGNRTPQVAFLTPFWDPAKVVRELWRDLYQPGIHRDLWFQWEGRPLILADPDLLDAHGDFAKQDTAAELTANHVLGQQFTADKPIRGVAARFPTWRATNSAVTLKLRQDSPTGRLIASQRFTSIHDNSWLTLKLPQSESSGTFYLEASEPRGKIGWWSHHQDVQPSGRAFLDGQPVDGDRTLRLIFTDDEAERIRSFFTFRKPQPDYFEGPTQTNMWSWLEAYPQHVFRNQRAEKEQMSVGVAQNAVRGRLGSMSEAGAYGRSRHNGSDDTRSNAVAFGFNFAEQITHALQEDPRCVFVTGWNEWIAGRFDEFGGVRHPVMFVDQFDQEHSRDIEPMIGGHGDNYYYQLVSFIRRYKGARAVEPIHPAPIRIDGQFADWQSVTPEFRDTIGDPARRKAPGWDTNTIYQTDSGRNDLVAAKFSADSADALFYVRTRDPLTAPTGRHWMTLFLNLDGNPTNHWMGYEFVINRLRPGSLERHIGTAGFNWEEVSSPSLRWKTAGNELELAIPWRALGLEKPPAQIDFKWGDNLELNGDWSDFTLHGDVAPNDRFNFRARLPKEISSGK